MNHGLSYMSPERQLAAARPHGIPSSQRKARRDHIKLCLEVQADTELVRRIEQARKGK